MERSAAHSGSVIYCQVLLWHYWIFNIQIEYYLNYSNSYCQQAFTENLNAFSVFK